MAGQVLAYDVGELRPPYPSASDFVSSSEVAEAGEDFESEPNLDAIYRKYAVRVRAYCARKLGDPVEAEDACHDVMLKAYGALPRFKPGAMWPWLVTISRNVCLDIHRRNIRRVRVQTRLEQSAVDGALPLEEVSADHQIIQTAASRLPARYRALIEFADIEGWSYEKIARSCNMSVGAVRSALMRARRDLKAEIERVSVV